MIKAPGWAGHAIPTKNGWEDPTTGELLKSGRHTDAQIAEWFGHTTPAEEEVIITATPEPEMLQEVMEEDDYASMSKLELEKMGREHGIELDRREKKSTLIEKLKNVVG